MFVSELYSNLRYQIYAYFEVTTIFWPLEYFFNRMVCIGHNALDKATYSHMTKPRDALFQRAGR